MTLFSRDLATGNAFPLQTSPYCLTFASGAVIEPFSSSLYRGAAKTNRGQAPRRAGVGSNSTNSSSSSSSSSPARTGGSGGWRGFRSSRGSCSSSDKLQRPFVFFLVSAKVEEEEEEEAVTTTKMISRYDEEAAFLSLPFMLWEGKEEEEGKEI